MSRLLAVCACTTLMFPWAGVLRAERTEEVAAAEVRMGTVSSSVLNVRARPATHYEVVCQLKRDDEVTIVGQNEQWFELLAPKHAKAYIAERSLGPDDRVTDERVPVYAGPGIVFTTFGHLSQGQAVKRVGAPAKEWQQIEPPDDVTVWVSQAFIEVRQPPAPEAPAEAVEGDQEVVATAAAAEHVPVAVPDDTEEKAPLPAKVGTSPHAEAVAELILPPSIVAEAPVAAETSDRLMPPVSDAVLPVDLGPEPGQQGAEIPLPAAPAVPETAPGAIVKSVPVSHTGVVFALPQSIAGVATHFLALRIDHTCYPICYLYSERIDLSEWELRQVRVDGSEVWYPGWQRPVIDVTGIQLDR